MSPGYFGGRQSPGPGRSRSGPRHRRRSPGRQKSCSPLMQASVCAGELPDVRPVEDAGDAGVDGAERADVVGGVDIVRRHLGAEGALHDVMRNSSSELSGSTLRRKPCHMWRWVSTKPGMTMRVATRRSPSAFGAVMFGCTAEIFLPSIRTSAFSKSPTALSRRQHAAALDQDRPARRAGYATPAPRSRAVAQHAARRDARGRGAKELTSRQPAAAGSTHNLN